MGQDIKNASEITTTNVKGPINSFETLKQKIDAVPGRKTVEVIINETTRKRTEVYGTSASSTGRIARAQMFLDEGAVTFNDAVYNMTAFNTGFNPSDDVARYNASVQERQHEQLISTKGIEERLDKLTELFKQFKELKMYLDEYTLVGKLATSVNREMARGARMKW